ncbi:MAG: glycine zipper domain-containing protein [Candidatus Omnitrophica bacterium]|nr:glycine zipper domain-containing protein [Candidatus Omnitrophota bacterium]
MKRISLFLAVCIFVTILVGCESVGENTKKGAGMGGLLGAVAGGVIGHQSGHGVEGALIGGAVGAIGGGTVGSGIDSKQSAQQPTEKTESGRIPIMKIVDLTEQGVPAEVIVDELKSSGSSYKIDAETIKYLEDKGVDQRVITYMVSGS